MYKMWEKKCSSSVTSDERHHLQARSTIILIRRSIYKSVSGIPLCLSSVSKINTMHVRLGTRYVLQSLDSIGAYLTRSSILVCPNSLRSTSTYSRRNHLVVVLIPSAYRPRRFYLRGTRLFDRSPTVQQLDAR